LNKSKVSYLVLSDIHLGHSRTKTEYIVNSLHNYFATNNKLFKKLDIIFIAGDTFDKLLFTSSKEYILAIDWLTTLALYCVKNNIKLRMLEGTPGHDWRQVESFYTIISKLDISLDYRYIQDLSIETMDDLGISILYMPDEVNHEAGKTYLEVKSLLEAAGRTQVDIGIFHGQFHHQLPMIKLESSHNEEDYLSIVKYYINIGHIHISSSYGRILAQGSFERLAHGEEGSKGGMVMNIYHTGDMDFIRVINKLAKTYVTYDMTNLDDSDIVKSLQSKLKKLDTGSRVRVIVANMVDTSILKPLTSRYQDIIFTVDKLKNKKENIIIRKNPAIKPFEIKKENLEELMESSLTKANITGSDLDIALKELKDVMRKS